ncbi:hypothetical protein GGI04_005544 [Coemansia thaxteri]|uniref:Uncharacterized protein n=1 Tax=Coemansia thaxteri TaxID=2663907 RepID=A0A9W8EGA2_9FUNG|nr:hypothetical protein GGI04_005544 [Coemansia thaxteri]KAJ2005161.1 hypothetical protein H4R26_002093 [Coemansia thaxteri]KAJ2462597.1 hypothetical protein GGI02_005426 [Coemansia sp. RSA 2322]KAJ2479127.1 hypothetical protein EV174_004110 [Coemansia sp. RSA 2320]
MNSAPAPAPKEARRASLESGSPIERLLAQAPGYTSGCELYPKALRDTINEFPEGAVLVKRDPSVTAAAEKCHQASIEKQRQRFVENPEAELSCYPGACRSADPAAKLV